MSRFQPIQSKYYSGFSPLNIGDCALWLDAADQSRYTMSGANLATWNDKSSNNYVCTPVSGNITQSTLNGLNVFFFNNVRALISNFVWTNDSTIFLVTRSPASLFLYSHWTTNYTHYAFPYNAALYYTASGTQYRDSVNLFGNPVQISNAWGIFVIGYDSTARVITNYAINGLARSAVLDAGTAPGAGSATATLFLNGNGTGPATSGSFVAEILHYNRSITTAERNQIESYLARKWGLQSLLPQLSYSNLPLNIPGCALWLDAADSSTVTLSGANVTQWNDKSGSNQHAIQAVVAKRPVYSNASVNGLSTVQTSAAAASGMYIPGFTVTYPLTTFVVSQKTGTGGGNAMFIEQSADVNVTSAGFYIFSANGDFYYLKRAGSAISVFGSNWTFNAVGTTYIYIAQISPNLIRVNANNIVTGNTVNSGTPAGSVTDQLNIGSRGQTTNLVGDVRYCEIIIYNGNITADQYYQIERYLALKWGVGTTTPHPYASIVPVTRAFQPIDISGCVAWLDAGDPSTVTLSGSNVTQWNDKAGNGYNAIPTGTTSVFTYSNTAFNTSYPGVTLGAASSTFFNLNIPANTFSNGIYGISVFRPTSSTTNYWMARPTSGAIPYPIDSYSSTTNSWNRRLIGNGSQYWEITMSGGYNFLTQSNTLYYFEANPGSTFSWVEFVNGVSSPVTGTLYSNGAASYSDAGSSTLRIYLQGIHCEHILFNRKPSTYQRQQLEGYLARKWGLLAPSTDLITFTPTQIPDCALWLDAADRSTITLSGSNVTQWSDKSGTSNHAVTSLRFSWLGPTVTSSNTLRFTRVAGTSVQMLRTQTGRQTTRPVTFAVVVKPIETNAGAMMDFQKTTNGQAFHALFPSQMNVRGSSGATITSYSFTQLPTSSFSVVCFQSTSNVFNGYINGTAFATATATLSMPITDAVYTTIGALTDLNYDGGGFATASNQIANTASSEFAEVLMFNALLNTTQRQQVEGYLAIKWGIRSSLPSTHPYAITSLPASHPMRTMLPATVSFNPRQIPNCALWLDAADLPTLTLSGSNVTTWLDKSGNGRNTSTFCNAPTFSNRAVRFSTNQGLAVNLSASSATESGFIVCGFTDYSVPSTLLGSSNGDGGRQFRVSGGVIQTVKQDIAGVVFSGTGLSLNTTQLTEYVNNGTTLTHYWNGATYASGSTISYTSGRTTSIGYRWGPFEPFNGYIQEILVYDRAVSTEERRQIEGYLAWKWGFETPLTQTLTSFLPTYISNCILWLDAGDSSTLTLSGSNVTQWNDKSGTSNNAVTGSRFPWLGPTITSSNSLKFTRVAGTSVQMLRTQTGRQTTTDVTYTVVVKPYNEATAATYFDLRKATNGQALVNLSSNAASYRGSTSSLYSFAIPASTSAFNVITLQAGTNRYAAYLNGNIIGSGTSTLDMPASDAAYTTIGAATDLNFSAGATSNNQILYTQTSEFYEIVMFNSYLTLAQIQQVEAYLASKWNVPIRSLPSTHPYSKINPC